MSIGIYSTGGKIDYIDLLDPRGLFATEPKLVLENDKLTMFMAYNPLVNLHNRATPSSEYVDNDKLGNLESTDFQGIAKLVDKSQTKPRNLYAFAVDQPEKIKIHGKTVLEYVSFVERHPSTKKIEVEATLMTPKRTVKDE